MAQFIKYHLGTGHSHPSHQKTTQSVGEEGGGLSKPIPGLELGNGKVSTQSVGEEGGGLSRPIPALDLGNGKVSTQSVGEEGGGLGKPVNLIPFPVIMGV
jgi:hypothetical protein